MTPSNFRKLFISKASILLSLSAVSVQASHPYERMETTSNLYKWNFVLKAMSLFRILVSFASAAEAVAMRICMSLVHVPSLERVAPRYLYEHVIACG